MSSNPPASPPDAPKRATPVALDDLVVPPAAPADPNDPAERLFAFLEDLGIQTRTVSHPAVFTVEEAKKHRVITRGVHIKNLFLRNKKGAMWLVCVQEDRPVDLKALGTRIGAGHVSFGSPDRLRKHLGVEPGSVTPFAAIHDTEGFVKVVLDRVIVSGDLVHCHPLRNDKTTEIYGSDLVVFLEATHHSPDVVDFDADPGDATGVASSD